MPPSDDLARLDLIRPVSMTWTRICRASLVTDAAKVRVAEAARIFQAEAEHAVEADVGDPDQRQRQGDRRAECKAGKRDRQSSA